MSVVTNTGTKSPEWTPDPPKKENVDNTTEPVITSQSECSPTPPSPGRQVRIEPVKASGFWYWCWKACFFLLCVVGGGSLGILIMTKAPPEIKTGDRTRAVLAVAPSENFLDGAAKLIEQSKQSVVIVGDNVQSAKLLKAAVAAAHRGVRVEYLISSSQNSSFESVSKWIAKNNGGAVLEESHRFGAHFLIVDSRYVMLAPLSWSSYDMKDFVTPVPMIDSPSIASLYLKYVESRKQKIGGPR